MASQSVFEREKGMLECPQLSNAKLFNGEPARSLELGACLEYDELQRSYFTQQGPQQTEHHDDILV